ncbi:MAG: bifunctional phosphoglucose/phosphomannose isomerase [Actinomycetota bacterium]|nr:bifunctional phosphoglucose/phosphomannose isomerase [Actinomycetota bacterium]
MSEMWKALIGLPDQLRWAADLSLPQVRQAPSALVIGMGGSGISGDFAAQVAAEAGRLCAVHKGYGLPGWAPALRPLVVAVSYSGNTEETLSGARHAAELGLPGVVVAGGGRLSEMAAEWGWEWLAVPGGLQPRAAAGYLTGAVLRAMEGAGMVPAQRAGLAEAASVLDELLGPDQAGPAVSLADDLADALAGRVVVVYGSLGPAAVAAQRWKTQINENAKAPAYWSVLPELDHNEIEGWGSGVGSTGRWFGIVLLRDSGEHPRLPRRFELTQEVIAPRAPVVGEVWGQGEGMVSRMFSLTLVGDLVSVRLAELAGTDPYPVEAIERLKRRLEEG